MTNVVTANSPFVEITAEIRKQARKLVKGYGCKVSVTKEEYAGGRKVYVTVTSSERNHLCPIFRKWQNQNPHSSRMDFVNPRNCKPGTVHLADWAIEMRAALKEIVEQFNWDKSDTMTDYFHVNYYTDVDFGYKLDQKAQADIDGAFAISDEEETIEEMDSIVAEIEAEQTNVVSVDFGSKGTPAPNAEPTNEELRAMLAKLDEERLALQIEVDRARERHELTIKIAEQMASIAALKNELDSLK